MNEYPSIEKLTGYLNGELAIDESNEIKAWFNQSDEGRKELEHLKIIWSLGERLRQMEKIDKQNAKRKVDSRTDSLKKSWKIFLQSFQKAAAILILPVLLFSAYLYFEHGNEGSTEQEFFATYGTRTTLVLPDGSKVWLNSGSKLRYERDFNRDNRTVFLTGEAFFDVTANKSKPFDVVTGPFTVRAVGTTFNVFSYENSEFETSLEEGITQVFQSGRNGHNKQIIKMKPGQRAVFDEKQEKLILSEGDVSQFSTWREGRLTFKNAPMNEVIMKLERWFNVDVELKDPDLLQYRYTAVFEHETIQQALEMLRFSSPIEYKILPGEKQQDNALSRSKVVIDIQQ
jgi:ferric-dicitrate binding protein FerR (iron transport regulator)